MIQEVDKAVKKKGVGIFHKFRGVAYYCETPVFNFKQYKDYDLSRKTFFKCR